MVPDGSGSVLGGHGYHVECRRERRGGRDICRGGYRGGHSIGIGAHVDRFFRRSEFVHILTSNGNTHFSHRGGFMENVELLE